MSPAAAVALVVSLFYRGISRAQPVHDSVNKAKAEEQTEWNEKQKQKWSPKGQPSIQQNEVIRL